jgi:hypothetical protein
MISSYTRVSQYPNRPGKLAPLSRQPTGKRHAHCYFFGGALEAPLRRCFAVKLLKTVLFEQWAPCRERLVRNAGVDLGLFDELVY